MPVRAGIVEKEEEYLLSSCDTFLNNKYSRITNPPNLSSDMRFANMADSGKKRKNIC